MIGCLFGLFAFFTPRIAIVLLWVFYKPWLYDVFAKLSAPFNNCAIPVVGLIFAPYTLLAYCFAWHQNGGKVDGMWLVLVIVAVLLDLGVIGHGGASRRRLRKRSED